MTRIPRTWWRSLALAGMVCVLPLAAFLWVLSGLATTVLESLAPDEIARAERFSILATIAGIAALTAIAGLALRRRGVAAVGSFGVSGAALAYVVDAGMSDQGLGPYVAVPLAVFAVGLAGMRAAIVPAPVAPARLAPLPPELPAHLHAPAPAEPSVRV